MRPPSPQAPPSQRQMHFSKKNHREPARTSPMLSFPKHLLRKCVRTHPKLRPHSGRCIFQRKIIESPRSFFSAPANEPGPRDTNSHLKSRDSEYSSAEAPTPFTPSFPRKRESCTPALNSRVRRNDSDFAKSMHRSTLPLHSAHEPLTRKGHPRKTGQNETAKTCRIRRSTTALNPDIPSGFYRQRAHYQSALSCGGPAAYRV